jgi:hypothetical protein
MDGSPSLVLLVTAVMLAISAFLFHGIDAPAEPPAPRAGLWREPAEGVRFTLTRPVLRAIALFLVLSPLFEEVAEEATGKTVQEAFPVDMENRQNAEIRQSLIFPSLAAIRSDQVPARPAGPASRHSRRMATRRAGMGISPASSFARCLRPRDLWISELIHRPFA